MTASVRRQVSVLAIGVLTWALVCGAFVPGSASAQILVAQVPPGGDALQWLRQAAIAPRHVSYAATRTVTVWAGGVQASQVRVFHQAPDRTRLEYLAVGDQPARIVVIAGDTQTTYVPSRNEVVRAPAPPTDEEALTAILPQIAENYDVRFDGTDRVAGRVARIIDVQSKFPNRPRLRVWVDAETRLILRSERYGPAGALREESAFIAVVVNPIFAAGMFQIAPAPGAQVETRRPSGTRLTIEEIANRVGFIPQLPVYLPPGYKLVGSRVVDVRGTATAVFAFTDGVATMSLFESLGERGAPSDAHQVQVGAAQGAVTARGVANVLHWNARGVSFTLVADLPQQDLVRVGASLPAAMRSRTPAAWPDLIRAWLARAARVPAAEAATPGVPPVPVSPFITNDTHVIGPGIRPEEQAIWRVLEARGLTPFVVKVTVASDGVTKLPDGRLARLVWVWFVYGMRWAGGGGAATREVQASAAALARAAFDADPRATRVVLSGYYHQSGRFDGRRTDATFTAELFRTELLGAPPGLPPGAALARAGHVWYAPELVAGDLVEHPYEAHDPHLPPGERLRLPGLPGDRTAESAENFHGGWLQHFVEIKARLQSLLFGGASEGRVWRGTPRGREIALTFDDGPSPLTTPLLLSILRRYGVHATFFVIGEHARAYPYLLREMRADGDEIGDHTYHHPNMTSVDDLTVEQEIGAAAAVIRSVTGRPPRWFRPPGGDYDVAVVDAADRGAMGLAMWTTNSGDWALPPANVVVERVLAHAQPGAVVLLHNGTLNTVRALPEIIVELKHRGYRLVTFSQIAHDAE